MFSCFKDRCRFVSMNCQYSDRMSAIRYRSGCPAELSLLVFFEQGTLLATWLWSFLPFVGQSRRFVMALSFAMSALSLDWQVCLLKLVALYQWQYLITLWHQPFRAYTFTARSHCTYFKSFLTLSLLFYWNVLRRTAVGVGSWCFHMTLLYEMQVGSDTELKPQLVCINTYTKSCLTELHGSPSYLPWLKTFLEELHQTYAFSC